jgi:hypothetical protein
LERAKIREELLSVFKMFHSSFILKKDINRNTALRRKGMEIATFLSIAALQFCLLSYWLTGVI